MEEVKIRIGIDGSDADAGVKRIIAGMETTQREVKRTGIDIDDLKGSLNRLGDAVSTAAAKFKESSSAADRLREELRGLAEGGASADVLIAKARELADAQRKAANDGAEALMANQKYWTALSIAGEDIGDVRTRHMELASSYNEMSARAKSTQTAVDEYSRKLSEERDRLKEVKTESEEAKRSTDKLKDSTDKASKSSKDYADKLNDVTNGAKGLPGPIGDAVSGIRGMTKASLRFIATPLGATLALISGLLATVTSWFKRTEEGQNALATGSAYFTQVLGSLLDVADDVGEWLYKAFTKPKEALTSLVDFMKGQVIDRLKDIGLMAQGIWRMLNGQFAEGMNLLGTGYAHGMSDLLSVKGKVSSWMGETKKKAEERVSIAQRQNKLDEEERNNLVERAKLEKEISELREKAYDNSVPEKERAKAIKDAQEKTEKMYGEELRLARERYEIIRDTNSLTHSNKDDKKKEAEAEAELYRIESQRANALKGLMREQNRVDSSALKSARAGAKAAKENADRQAKELQQSQKHAEEIAKMERETLHARTEAEIAGIKDAGQRERKERKLQHSRTIEDIKDQQEDIYKKIYQERKSNYETANKGKHYELTELGNPEAWKKVVDETNAAIKSIQDSMDSLDPSQLETVFTQIDHLDLSGLKDEEAKMVRESLKKQVSEAAEANAKYVREDEQRYNQLIQQHQSYTDQRLEIDRRYQEEVTAYETAIAELRKKLATAGTDEERQAIEGQIEALTRSLGEAAKGRLKELSDVAGRELQDSPLFSLAWKDLQNVSTETLNMLIEKFKEVEGQFSGDPQAMKEWTERIQAMSDEVAQRNPYKAIYEARTKYQVAETKRNNAIGRIDTITKEIAELEELIEIDKKSNSSNETTAKNQEQLKQKREELTEATTDLANAEKDMTDSQTQEQNAFSESKRQVDELASAISALGNEIGGEAGKILNLIGNVMTFATSTAENMKKVAATGAQSISTMEKASVILTIISAAIQLAKQISELLPDTTSQYEKYRDKVNEVNKMEQAVRDYEMAVLEAKNAEKSWFASSSLNNLSNQWLVSSKASENYFKKLNELQATYQNESGSGWLTKLGAQANKTIASITGKVNELVGIEDTFLGNMQTKMAQFGWANAMGGQIGMNMYLENEIWDKGFDKNYVEGLTAAWRNLRIETREAKKGFLGTGVGGRSQRTEDLVQYVKKELGLDLFDKDGWLNQEAYEQVIEKYGDKLVGETKETLEALNELKEKHDEFLEQLHEYVDNLYSPIVDNFVDAMWEWYDEGTDALEAFQKAAGDTFRKIVSDLLDTQMLKLFGNEMGETITQLYTDYFDKGTISYGELMSGVTQAVGTASAKFVEAQPVLKATMLSVEESLSKMGIEMKGMGDTASGIFSDLSQAYRSMLLNMESDTKDFGDEVIRILTESLIDKFILGDEFEKRIEEITKKATSIVEATHVVVDADGNRTFISSIEEGVIKAQNSIAEFETQIQELSKQLANEQSSIMQEHVKELEKLRKKQEELDRQWLDNKLTQSQYNEAVEALAEEIAALEIAYEQQAQENEKILAITAEIDSREKRIRELKQDIYNIEHSETITEEERKAALQGIQDELLQEYETRQNLVKTMKDMMGLTMIEKINASSLANLGDDLLSVLQDTSKSVEEWKDEIVKTMTDDLIKELVYNEEYKQQIRAFQEEYIHLFDIDENGNLLKTEEEIEAGINQLATDMANFATKTEETADRINNAMGQIGGSTTESPFSNLRDTFLNTLADMEGDAEKFRETLNKTLMQDLIEKMVLDVPMTVSIEGVEKAFDNFDAYSKDWNDRYVKGTQEVAAAQKALREAQISGDKQAIESAEKRYNAAKAYIDSIIDEMVEVQAISLEAAEEFKKRMKEVQKDTTFTDMKSNFVNALMDMEGSVEDFANDIKKTIVQHLVESFMVSKYIQPLLDDLQYSLDFAMKQYGTEGWELGTPEGMAAWLQNDWTEYLEDGTEVVHKGINSVAAEINPVKDLVKALMKSIGYEVKEGGENASGEAASAFDNLGDTILSSLMNTESGVEDFMKSLNETIVNELVESYMATDQFKQELNDVKVGLKDAVDNVVRWEQAVKNAKTDEEFAYANEQLKVANQLLADAKQSAEALYNSAAEGTEKYTKALKKVEVQQDTTFKDLGDSLLSALMDTTKSATDWAKDIGQTMAQKIFQGMMEARNAQGILDKIQFVFNEAVTSNTDANGNINWEEVASYEGLTAVVSDGKREFNSLREAWKQVCEALGLDFEEALNDLPLSDLGSNLIDSLLDTEQTAEDFGKKMAVNLMTEMLTELFNDRYTTKLNEVREHWQKALAGEDGYTLDSVTQEIKDLRTELDNLAEDDPISALSGDIKDLGKAIEELPFSEIGDTIIESLLDVEDDAGKMGQRIARNLLNDMLMEMVNTKYINDMNDIREMYRSIVAGEGLYSMDDLMNRITALRNEIGKSPDEKGIIQAIQDLDKAIEETVDDSKADETFKGMADSWTSALTDMDATAEDFGRQIGQTLVQKLVNELIVSKHLQKYLDDIQAAYDEAIGKEGADVNSVLAAVIPKIDAAVEETKEWLPVTQELAKRFKEIGGDETPFDNLRSSLLSALMDMNGDAKDWSKSIAESLTEAFIDKFVLGEAFDKRLAEWQEEYRDIMDGTLSPEERAKQLKELGAVISDAKEGYAKEAKAIHELMGTAEYGDQDATVNMADKATYDQFEMYLGIALSQQMCGEQQLSIQQQILATLQTMGGVTSPNNDALLTQVAMANVHLQSIRDFSAEIRNLVANINMNISSLNGKI